MFSIRLCYLLISLLPLCSISFDSQTPCYKGQSIFWLRKAESLFNEFKIKNSAVVDSHYTRSFYYIWYHEYKTIHTLVATIAFPLAWKYTILISEPEPTSFMFYFIGINKLLNFTLPLLYHNREFIAIFIFEIIELL